MTDAATAFYGLIHARRSIRRFRPERVPEAVACRVLAAACRAPSAHNRQPWRFVVLGQGGCREALVAGMEARWRQDLTADGLPAEEIERTVARGRQRLLQAPLLVLVLMTMADMDRYPDARRQAAERTMAVQSVAMAGALLLLAAQAEGLGACWVCAPLFAPEVVREVLDLPADWEAQGAVLLGYPADGGRERPRRPLEEVSLWR